MTFVPEDGLIFTDILKFLGSQNFALTTTNIPEMCILRNLVNGRGIFCVLADNTKTRICSASQLLSINSSLLSRDTIGLSSRPEDILFIVITGDVNRDKGLASIGLNVWLADEQTGRLLIYENQPEDFYGLRYGIENTMRGEYSDGMFEFGTGKRARASAQKSRALRNIPYVTIALIVLNIAYYLVLSAMGRVTDTSFMLSMGASFGPYIFGKFQIWRLVTAMFMHFSLLHLGTNMLYLGIAGYNMEKICGHFRFLLIYMLSGIGGNVVSAAWYSLRGINTVSGGASGAIYGLVGGIALLTFLSFRKLKATYVFARIIILLIFVFYSSFARTGVDGAAHIGGFFFGILLTFLLVIGGRKNERR